MITYLALFLGFQLVGEVIARALHLSLPGPVIGMSTVLAIGAGALTFKYVNHLLGVADETPE